jgi:hypothetical protein
VLWPYKVPVVVLSGHQPSWLSPGGSVAGAAYAGLLFPTLAYVEKVRSQFLSLRQTRELNSLRFYWNGGPSDKAEAKVQEAIDLAEARSACTCEQCGEEGYL